MRVNSRRGILVFSLGNEQKLLGKEHNSNKYPTLVFFDKQNCNHSFELIDNIIQHRLKRKR